MPSFEYAYCRRTQTGRQKSYRFSEVLPSASGRTPGCWDRKSQDPSAPDCQSCSKRPAPKSSACRLTHLSEMRKRLEPGMDDRQRRKMPEAQYRLDLFTLQRTVGDFLLPAGNRGLGIPDSKFQIPDQNCFPSVNGLFINIA